MGVELQQEPYLYQRAQLPSYGRRCYSRCSCGRDLHGAQGRAVLKRAAADGGEAPGQVGFLQGRAAPEDADGQGGQALRQGDLPQGRAVLERAAAQLGEAPGQTDRGKADAAGKGVVAHLLQTGGQGRLFQGLAVGKGPRADLGDPVPDDQPPDLPGTAAPEGGGIRGHGAAARDGQGPVVVQGPGQVRPAGAAVRRPGGPGQKEERRAQAEGEAKKEPKSFHGDPSF